VIGRAPGRRSGDTKTDLGSPQDGELRLGSHERTLKRGVRLGRLIAAGRGEHRDEFGLGLGQDRDRGGDLLGRREGIAFGSSRELFGRGALQCRSEFDPGDCGIDLGSAECAAVDHLENGFGHGPCTLLQD
jgi:hypothetical protein